jgi:hypothetical protein
VTISASAGDVQTFAGTTAAKLVFVNVSGEDRTLCFVDFSHTFPHVLEYLDDQNVYMPAISPDGRFAAYCSGDVGLSGPSEVTVRSLDSLNSPKTKLGSNPAYAPRWWTDMLTKDTFLVYTSSAVVNGNDALWKSTGTFLQKMKGGRPVGNPEEIVSDGSYHDGLSADKRYIVTGYTRLMMKDLVTNEEKQLFLSPENGKDANGSNQVCNVSISPDTGSAVRCMFLDFGYPRISSLTGCSYDPHQFVFISTMKDSITTFMHCPDGEQSWDNPQWSNHARFAVGCGRNSEDKAHAIYAIDITKKNSMRIATGAELQQPYLWTGAILENYSNLSIDSLGRYNDPSTSDVQVRLSVKFLMFWQVCQPLNIAVVGSSQAFMGIDPRQFTGGLTSFNLASPGNDFTGQKIMILNYILKHCPDIKLICSSFELFWLANPSTDSSWGNGLSQSKGYLYDSSHGFWPGAVTNDFKNIIAQVPFAYPPDTTCSGFSNSPSVGWGGNPPDFWGTPLWDTSDANYKKNVAAIRMLADTLRSRGIHWLMINFPISPYYKNTDLYCWAGPLRSTAREVIQGMEQLDTANEFFHFYDANMDGTHDYGNDEANDVSHLSTIGAAKLSVRVDSIIHSILGN